MECDMNRVFLILAMSALPLTACGKTPSEDLADRVENAAEAEAAAIEAHAAAMANQAEHLDSQAEQIRETGRQRSDAIEAAGQNVADMPEAQANAIVAGEQPAVR
jgi:hypothetical protein